MKKSWNGLSEGAGIGRINVGRIFTDVILLTLMLSQYKRSVCCAVAGVVVLAVLLVILCL